MSDDGKMAAYVVEVKRGGPADVQAKLQEGKILFHLFFIFTLMGTMW